MSKQITPTLFIGLGGTGHMFVSNLKDIIQRKFLKNDTKPFPLIKYRVFDTEFISVPYRGKVVSAGEKEDLEKWQKSGGGRADYSYETSIQSCIEFSEQCDVFVPPKDIEQWLSDYTLLGIQDFMPENHSNIVPGTFGASQMGILGKIMGIAHLGDIKKKLKEVIDSMAAGNSLSDELARYWGDEYNRSGNHLSVYIACSLGGGTGRGLHLIVALMIRYLLGELDPAGLGQNTKIILINFLPDCFETPGRMLPHHVLQRLKANEYAGLKELDYIFANGFGSNAKPGEMEVEAHFKNHFGINGSLQLRVFDSVVQISSKLHNGSVAQLDSYKMVNDIAAYTLASGIFSNFQGTLESTMCNPNNPIREAETQIARVCKYGRIGSSSLRYPVGRLCDYLKNWTAMHAVLDLQDGHLEKPPTSQPHDIADRLYDVFSTAMDTRFTVPSAIIRSELGKDVFETAFSSKAQQRFAQMLNAQKSNHVELEKRILGAVGYRDKPYIREAIETVEQMVLQEIKDHGIKRALDVIDQLQIEIDGFYRESIAESPVEVQEEGLLPLSNALDEYISALEATISVPFTMGKHPLYEDINQAMDADRDRWEKNRSFFQKMGIVQEKDKNISPQSRMKIDNLIHEFYTNIIMPSHKARKLHTKARFFIELKNALLDLENNINTNKRLLSNRDEYGRDLGLIPDYQKILNDIVNMTKDPTEIYVYGRNKEEYELFCSQFYKKEEVFREIQRELDTKITPLLIRKDEVTSDLIRSVLQPVVQTLVERHTQDMSFSWYFQQLYRNNNLDRVKTFWKELYQRASWLGAINVNRIEPKDRDREGFNVFNFLELATPEDYTLCSDAVAIFGQNLQKVQRPDLRETVIFTRYQVAMPLFVCNPVVDCAGDYESEVRHIGDMQAHDAGLAEAVMAEYHTSKEFFYIDEPLGRITHIPDSEKADTLNLMLYLGIIEIDDENYLRCLQQPDGSVISVMKRWLPTEHRHDDTAGLLYEEFAANLSRDNRLIVHLLELTTDHLLSLANPICRNELDRRQYQDLFLKLLTDEAYPLIPKTLLRNRIMRYRGNAVTRILVQAKFRESYERKQFRFSQRYRPILFYKRDAMIREMQFQDSELLQKKPFDILENIITTPQRSLKDQPVQSSPESKSMPSDAPSESSVSPSVPSQSNPAASPMADPFDELRNCKQLLVDGCLDEEAYHGIRNDWIEKLNPSNLQSTHKAADVLRQLKSLKDETIITTEEFDSLRKPWIELLKPVK